MKQVLQNLRSGETTVTDVPRPGLGSNDVVIRTRRTLISAGTERMLVEFGKAGLIGKARSQPDKVKQVLDKIKTDGLMPTLEAVFNRLDEPLPLGYCNAGVVEEVGSKVTEFKPGDRVISNGPHAEFVCVPQTLCAKIPDNVSDDQAAFTVLSSIGLQGIRLLQPNLGDRVVVIGLGLIGLVAVQLLRSSGCAVLGVDLNPERLALAEKFGAITVNAASGDPITAAMSWTNGKGVDAALVTAATKSDEPMHQAAEMCRKRGRIIMIGNAGLNLRHSDFYEKELSFQLSCSYGPGRYDESYEQGGQDYPYGFVRWTEQRNMQAILEAISSGMLKVDELITHHFPLDVAPEAYEKVSNDRSALGVILEYGEKADDRRVIETATHVSDPAKPVLGVIGAGNFTKVTLMPALAKAGAELAWIANLRGPGSAHLAGKFNAARATTDYKQVLADPAVQAVMITVRNQIHTSFAIEALQAGKHVFVEKPLAINANQLAQLVEAYRQAGDRQLMVGFNRRFSPHIVKMKELLAGRSEPLAMSMTVNAGPIPPDDWNHDPNQGGGRIVAEGCHFIDLMVHLTGANVVSVAATQFGQGVAVQDDKMSITMTFADGSIGTVHYWANGTKSYPKEMLEVFTEGRILKMENFRRTLGFGVAGFKKMKTSRQDKGHRAEMKAFVDLVRDGGDPLIPFDELVNVTLASFAAMKAAKDQRTILLADEYPTFA
jgi:predicted dehydrogenase